ncbi:MAG: L-fucose mutarotase [Treponema sp.]|nr:L-fucose mutarotase [Treponema sp.]
MLINISPVISPDLLYALASMGHGDEIVLADAFYPGSTMSSRCIRADGVKVPDLLDGILRLMNPDDFVKDPVTMMSPVPGDSADPNIEKKYREIIDKYWPDTPPINFIDRFEFYERAKKAYAVVVSGETVKYGCVIIKKGVIPVNI